MLMSGIRHVRHQKRFSEKVLKLLKKTYRSAYFSVLNEKRGQLFNIFPRKNGSIFDQLCQAGLTGRNCGCHPDFFNTAFTALFERNVSEMLLCVILFPHLWYHKKICSSVAHHYLRISKIHQKDLRWNVEDPCHSVSPVNPCVRRGTDACKRAVGGVGSATPEWLPYLCHSHSPFRKDFSTDYLPK